VNAGRALLCPGTGDCLVDWLMGYLRLPARSLASGFHAAV